MMKMISLRNLLGATCAAAALLVAGCGGGGGGGGSSGSSSGTSTPVVTTPTLSVMLIDTTTGAATNTLALGSSVKASATVLDGSKKPVANTVVTFSANPATLVAMTPVAATALTDANGVASVLLAPASISASGAGTLTATAPVGSASPSGSVSFSVGSASINLSGMAVGQNPLSAYGTTSVTVNITGVPATYPVTVNFTSTCAGSAKATLTASTQSVNGIATANYTDNKCASTDTITASVAGTTVSTSTTLTVQAPDVASIQFVSASPETIVLKGTGAAGYQESSLVKFKVVDNNNQAVANTNVKFDLNTRTGGILLENSASAVTKQTDANGEVQVSVLSGTVPTPVWVSAEVTANGNTFKTQSVKLTISTGRPAQDRFSVSVATHNIEAWNYDNVTDAVSVVASDRMGNPVPNGTTINFVSSGAQIQPSCQTTDGKCGVTFTSGNPRPTGHTEPSPAAVSAGRVAIIAYAVGEESFFDANGNNSYDNNELFTDLGDVFFDSNENGAFDVNSEQYIPFDITKNIQSCTAKLSNSPAALSKAGSCDGAWGTAHVRQSNLIIMSGSSAFINDVRPTPGITENRTYSMASSCESVFSFFVYDLNRNPMPAGTKLSISNLPANITATVLNDTVVDTTAPGGTQHGILVKKTITDATTGACPLPNTTFPVFITVTTPKLLSTTIALTINP